MSNKVEQLIAIVKEYIWDHEISVKMNGESGK